MNNLESKRKGIFEEAERSLSREEAAKEASRCLKCQNPGCVAGCPASIDIPNFINCISCGNESSALKIINKSSNLPFACSRLCPRERMCEGKCSEVLEKPIGIAGLERYAYENAQPEKIHPKKKPKKVAVIGSGPAGLSCAEDLAVMGYDVTLFEALHSAGGILRCCIPNFRLPHRLVDDYLIYLASLGVKLINNAVIGRLITLPELKKKYSAVFIATGSTLPTYMNIEGEHLQNIITANEFLYRINVIEQHLFDSKNELFSPKRVVVVGGNDSAIDAARMAVRLGSSATIIFQKSFNELEASYDNVSRAREEGVKFLMLSLPKRYTGASKMECVEVIQMKSEEDELGNSVSVEIADSEFMEQAELAILSLGTTASPIVVSQANINHNLRGNIFVDENLMTSAEGIFSGGAVTGASTVVESMCLGKKAAISIDRYLSEQKKEVELKND
ncbi:MAG TPA: FAD-dependent oxidoreductase [Candidatus Nanoarchaeia archaeon]|nr:FAD-dependent oxidoreductase [Candidatus Nanoarchaeia archaeon]